MVNFDILGGLKSALERGDSLEKAMRTLFNANYKKEEIEEAAKSLAEFKPEREIQPIMKSLPKIKEILPSSQVSIAPARTRSVQELKSALEREHSLKKAMLILFNSGYKLEEIVKAARDLLEFSSSPPSPSSPTTSIRFIQPAQAKPSPVIQTPTAPPKEINIPTIIRIPGQMQRTTGLPLPQAPTQTLKSVVEFQRPVQKPIQKVSKYEKPPKEKVKGRTIIITLVCLLVFLVSLEGVIFIFKQQFINFLNSFLG